MGVPVDLRVDARLHRPRRGRPDAPAGRAPRGAARDPRPQRRPPGRRQRDGRRRGATILERTDGPVGLVLPAQNVPTLTRAAWPASRPPRARRAAATCCSRPSGGTPRGHPHRHRLRGAARRRGPRDRSRPPASPTRVVSMPCWSGSRSRTRRTGSRCCRPSVKARVSVEAGIAPVLAPARRRRRPDRLARALRRLGRRRGALPASSASPPRPSSRRRTSRSRAAASARTRRPPSELTATSRSDLTDAGPVHRGRRRRSGSTMAPSSTPQARLADAGVAIWLDDLSRERLRTGNLAELIDRQHVVGVTTNPSIFAEARCPKGDAYDEQLAELAAARRRRRRGRPHDHHGRRPRRRRRPAPGLRRHRRRRTAGSRSRSTRGWPQTPTARSPRRKHAVAGWWTGRTCSSRSPPPRRVCRRSPRSLGRGHQRQRHADLLARALPRGHRRLPDRPGAGARPTGTTCRRSHSVASFFVSRVDTEIDKRLDAIGTDEADGAARQGRRSPTPGWPTRLYQEVVRRRPLDGPGRRRRQPQRPLWASTGVKDPAYQDTLYVDELVVAGIVNTMPEATLDAVADHGEITRRHGHAARYERGARPCSPR